MKRERPSILQNRQSSCRTLDSVLETAYNHGNNHFQYWKILLSLGICNASDASEILCLSYILSDARFEDSILQNTHWRAGLLASAIFCGMLLGGLLVGTLGDCMGRRPMLLGGLVGNALAGLASAACQSVYGLLVLRFLAGIGIGATIPPLFTLVTELAPPSQRGFFVTICASFWMIGSVYVALVALWLLEYRQASWRIFAVVCALPSALGAGLVHWNVPPSPRFLALQGRRQEAIQVVHRLCKTMGHHDSPPFTAADLAAQFPASGHQTAVHQSGSPIGNYRHAYREFRRRVGQLYATKSLRATTWPLQLVWFSLSFGSYGMLTWINTIFVQVHLENVYQNALLFALSNLPGNVLAAVLLDRLGRTVLLVVSLVAACLSLVAFCIFASSRQQLGIVGSACAFQCFASCAWNTMDCMTSELFPTSARSTGMGVCAASGRIGAMMAQLVNGRLIAQPVRLLLVASLTLLLGALTPCWLPDMTGQALQDNIDLPVHSGEFLPLHHAESRTVVSSMPSAPNIDAELTIASTTLLA